MTITDKVDFKAKVRASMCQLQNDPEKIRTKNYRSNMPPDSAFTYGLINSVSQTEAAFRFIDRVPTKVDDFPSATPGKYEQEDHRDSLAGSSALNSSLQNFAKRSIFFIA